MSIVAALDKVLFFNASSKYSVLRMKTEDSSVPAEARSPYRYHDHLIRFTAVGIELPQTDTVKIEMDGEWKDGKYGLQLQVDHWQEIVPPTLEGVRNYLASGLLKGIGEKTADAIIEKFGINALEILEHQPDRLLEIRGITKERLAEIKDAYAETSRMRVLMTLLAPFKVTPTTAQKIYQHFGPACADIVRQSPFNLCQVPGFGFKRKIPYKERLVVTGEAFIRPSDFEALKDTLRDGNGEPYKNGRNLAAGSVRLLDCGACKDRHVTFMAFNVLEGFEEYPWKSQRLRAIEQLGFPICKYLASKQALTQFDMDAGIRHLRKYAQENDIPIDGIVVTYNDATYARSCGRTGHHYISPQNNNAHKRTAIYFFFMEILRSY